MTTRKLRAVPAAPAAVTLHDVTRERLAALDRDGTTAPADRALALLAEHYAAIMEQASVVEAAVQRAVELANREDPLGEDVELRNLLKVLRARLSVVGTAKDIGPLLHKALSDLGASPAGRAAQAPRGGNPTRAPGSGRLAQLRGGEAG